MPKTDIAPLSLTPVLPNNDMQALEQQTNELFSLIAKSQTVRVLPNGAIAVKIATDEDFVSAGTIQKSARDLVKGYDGIFKIIKKPIQEASNAALAWEKEMKSPLQSIDSAIKNEIDRAMQQKEREKQALERELQRQAQEDEEKRAADTEAMLREEGFDEAADEEVERFVEAPPPTVSVPITQPIIPGMRAKTPRYKAKVLDKATFLKYCLDNPVLIDQFVDLNSVALNAQATRQKENFSMPGVTFEKYYV